MKFITPQFIQNSLRTIKEQGIKAYIRKNGWKIVAVIIVFYLIRDTILFIIIPYLIINNIISCG